MTKIETFKNSFTQTKDHKLYVCVPERDDDTDIEASDCCKGFSQLLPQ